MGTLLRQSPRRGSTIDNLLSVTLLTILFCRLILGKLVASCHLLNIKIRRIIKYSPNWVHREFLVN